jgi:hypothetical protein
MSDTKPMELVQKDNKAQAAEPGTSAFKASLAREHYPTTNILKSVFPTDPYHFFVETHASSVTYYPNY